MIGPKNGTLACPEPLGWSGLWTPSWSLWAQPRFLAQWVRRSSVPPFHTLCSLWPHSEKYSNESWLCLARLFRVSPFRNLAVFHMVPHHLCQPILCPPTDIFPGIFAGSVLFLKLPQENPKHFQRRGHLQASTNLLVLLVRF